MSDIHEVNIDLDRAKKVLALADAIRKLETNKYFKLVVKEHYFEKEAIRLVQAKSDPRLQDEKHQKLIDADIRAIGSFQQFLQNSLHFGEMAKKAIEDHEAALSELREEGEDE